MSLASIGCWQGYTHLANSLHSNLPRETLEQRIADFSLKHMVNRCKKEHAYSDEDMEIIEKELKRYFLMIALDSDKNHILNMYSKDVDNLWHAFILFTKEYHVFSQQICGHYIHHTPNLDKDRKKTAKEFLELQKEYRDFILYYEATFNEPIHPIWLLDAVEKEAEAAIT